MAKYVATKAFRGVEGPVRVGQVLDTADHETLTRDRLAALTRNGLIEPYRDKMAAAPRNQAFRSPAEPIGVVSPNAGGLTDLRWNPEQAQRERVRAIGEEEGDDENPSPDGQNGSSTSPAIGQSSFSRPDRAPKAPATPSGERPRRGRRPAS